MKEKINEQLFKIKRLCVYFSISVRLSWKASPFLFCLRIFFELIAVLVPIYTLYLSRQIINILGSSTYAGQREDFYRTIVVLAIVQLVGSLIGRLNGYVSGIHNDYVGHNIDLEIIDQINKLDISYFDNPIFYDQIQIAMRDSRSLQTLSWLSISIIKTTVQLISNFILLISLNVWLPVLIIFMCIPGLIIDKYVSKRKYDWQLKRSRSDRKLGYIKGILESKATAKDVRLFGVKDYFRSRYIEMWKVWFKEKNHLERMKLILSFSASVLPHLATTAVLVFVGVLIFLNNLSIGDYSFYGGIATQLKNSISAFAGIINQSYESELRITKYIEFLNLRSRISNDGKRTIDRIETIEFKNVTFTYPSTQSTVLKNISFDVKKGQSIALVGLNGAGKSTIVKLILRLYDPDIGEIFVNGINLKEYELNSYYKCIGTVFQDFCRYNLTLRETIALTNIDEVDNDEKILEASKNADFDLQSLNLEQGLNTYLGKRFDPDGVELSGGNWQKIAIAQAYFKPCSLMVFDEPNSALDPLAERRLFEKIEMLSENRCVIYVTHRLASATTADHIVVINNGECVEMGSHTQLMELGGLYFDLFTKQAEKYREDIKNKGKE